MLTIEHHSVEECITLGALFDELGFPSTSQPTDASGDSFLANEWEIEVKSKDGFFPIEGFRWTKPERQIKLSHQTISPDHRDVSESFVQSLQCSPEHLVYLCIPRGTQGGWGKAGDLQVGDWIVVQNLSLACEWGYSEIKSIEPVSQDERLCDLQVSTCHSYYASNVLSHNSHFLVMLGANAIRAGINVLHYTMELSETMVGVRYDSNLCDIDSNEIIDSRDAVLSKYKDAKLGRLMIKEFPSNTATVYTLRSHMERLDLKGFKPGLVIIDYADIMRSTRQYDSLRHELKLLYEELRALSMEKGIPIWTASQSNKEGSTSDIVDLGNMSEAYGKAMVCDAVLSLSRKAHEKASGWGRLYVAKNRAGKDGIVYPIRIDTAKSRFEIAGRAGSLEEATAEDDGAMKKALRTKWNELKNDPDFQQKKIAIDPAQGEPVDSHGSVG